MQLFFRNAVYFYSKTLIINLQKIQMLYKNNSDTEIKCENLYYKLEVI